MKSNKMTPREKSPKFTDGRAYLPLSELPLHQGLVLEEILGPIPGSNAFLETRFEVFLAPVMLPRYVATF